VTSDKQPNENVDAFDALLQEEKAGRLRVKSVWDRLDALLRHPAALLVLGFALTGGIGGFIQNRQHRLEQDQTEVANAYLAINHIRQAISEFALRAELYDRSSGDGTEVAKAREAAQEAWVKAGSSIQNNSYAVLAAFPDAQSGISGLLRVSLENLRAYILKIDVERFRERPIAQAQTEREQMINDSLDSEMMSVAMSAVQSCTDSFFLPLEVALRGSSPNSRKEMLEWAIGEDAPQIPVASSPIPVCPRPDRAY
jgi:hypothetical protein